MLALYRRQALGLWVEVPGQVCLAAALVWVSWASAGRWKIIYLSLLHLVTVQVFVLVEGVGIVGFTLMARSYAVFFIVSIPPLILLIGALFNDHQRSDSLDME